MDGSDNYLVAVTSVLNIKTGVINKADQLGLSSRSIRLVFDSTRNKALASLLKLEIMVNKLSLIPDLKLIINFKSSLIRPKLDKLNLVTPLPFVLSCLNGSLGHSLGYSI